MREINEKRYSRVEIEAVNALALEDTAKLVEKSEGYYNSQVMSAAKMIKAKVPQHKFILLCGPSASGKTTTAHKLKHRLIELGVGARVVSMDNFFTGVENYPLLPTGKPDMESIEALDLKLLNSCFNELLETGRSLFPVFDFVEQVQRKGEHLVEIGENDVLIMEGIHALNPLVLSNIAQEKIFRIYVSVRTKFINGEETVLVPKDIRLIRRLVRDYKFRGYAPRHTLEYWHHVVASEKQNIDLYRDDVNLKMDNTIDYEVCVWHSLLHNLIESLSDGEYPELERIFAALKRFPEVDYSLIPKNSLLREFIGEDK